MKRSALQLALSYLIFLWKSKSIYAIHSPFLFSLIDHLKKAKPFSHFQNIETERKKLRNDRREIKGIDFGAGSRQAKMKRVCDIARHSLKPKKQAQLLYHIADHFEAENILELGTSLGISSAYLTTNGKANVLSLEGNEAIAKEAAQVFSNLGISKIKIIIGNIDETLGEALREMSSPDLVFLDANHRREPCLRYYNSILNAAHQEMIVILDDIHWSTEMEEAWEEIIKDERVSVSVDLFHFGLVFLHKGMTKQDFVIRI